MSSSALNRERQRIVREKPILRAAVCERTLEQNSRPGGVRTSVSRISESSEAMAEISADFSERCEALEADTEDKTQSLKPHAQAHLLSATEYCKVKILR